MTDESLRPPASGYRYAPAGWSTAGPAPPRPVSPAPSAPPAPPAAPSTLSGAPGGPPPTPSATQPGTVLPPGAPRLPRAPRRARLVVRRVDPWSVVKLSGAFSGAVFVIIVVAVAVLYAILSWMGVFRSIDSFLHDVGASDTVIAYFSFLRVFLVAVIVGLVNWVLFTALFTVGALIYNLCADLVGGVEVTLTEPE